MACPQVADNADHLEESLGRAWVDMLEAKVARLEAEVPRFREL